jgi:cytochrome c-type biogenesis protein CcmH/NrfG
MTTGGVRADPLYAEGMAALQEGRWADALRAFETLVARHPGDAAALGALEQTQLRARVDESARRIRAKRFDVNWRPVLFRVALVLVVVALGL